jgi:Ca-activated chloride channel family protein
MPKTMAVAAALALAILTGVARVSGQDGEQASYRVNVHLVVQTFSVIDAKGNSVSGLRPEDVRIFEDGIPQKIVSFAEGSKPSLRVSGGGPRPSGTSVFILFDTSNRMYHWFSYVIDSIADFVRDLSPADSVAIYTFSRNLLRAAPLATDHALARAGLRNAMAGDETALFNCLLLTLRDAAKVEGRRAVVVFSNGPDDVSMVTPDDVGRVAEDEGIPVYIISTHEASRDKMLSAALERLTQRTGGKLYQASAWQHQARAFAAIREDISSSYTAYYYPAPNSNEGFRNVRVEIVSGAGKKCQVRTRTGYQFRKPIHGPTN